MEIKICGMTSETNMREVAVCDPDYFGLIFHAPSPRNAIGLSPDVRLSVCPRKGYVGVFVDKTEDEIVGLIRRYRLSAVQLHGNESPGLCQRLRERGFTVWKAVGIGSAQDFKKLEKYVGCVDRFVFDRKSPGYGGSGLKFDWKLLDNYTVEVDFMLGGGIGPDDAGELLKLSHPRFIGIDLNSRFEVIAGVKDSKSLESFIKRLDLRGVKK